MGIKIYLDDERRTPEGFIGCRWPADVIACLKRAEAEGVEVEILSLDHDLGEGCECERPRTGYDVLLWLEEQVFTRGYVPPKHLLIHSANPAAKERMRAARFTIYTKAKENANARR